MVVRKWEEPALPATRQPTGRIILVAGVSVAAAFLTGFLLSYAKEKRLESDLRLARQENRMAQLRDLAGLAYLQASQKNYGIAAGVSARFFERCGEIADQTPDANIRRELQSLLIDRDKITAELAKGDSGVLDDLKILFLNIRQVTGVSPSR